MLTIRGLDARYGSQILFQEASLQIEAGWTVGLIGPNGSGKSTLFRLLTGQESTDAGDLLIPNGTRIGYFDQKTGEMGGRSAVDQAILAAGRVAEVRTELAELEHAMADPARADEMERLMTLYCNRQGEFQTLGGYEIEAQAREVLAGLGFTEERMDADVGELSGGWKMRVSLAGILIQQADLLLLDEPTNHLDLESILWLEAFIRDCRATVIMTCHDHEFMNRVVDRIVEIDEGKLRLFPGDYDFYLAQRAMEDKQRHAAFERQQAHIDREMRWINSFRAKARLAGQAQSRLKRLEKIEKLDPPRSRRKRVVFRIPPTPRSGNDVFVAEGIGKSYGENCVLDRLELHLRRGERWVVLGVNGAGKTTLLKIVQGGLDPDQGAFKRGVGLKVGYFAQHTTEQLHPDQTVFGTMQSEFPVESIGALRKCLAGFGFEDHDIDKPTRFLSGGEKARLVLARMLFDPPNFLVLDEPTNHLDVESRQALIDALSTYDGTMLFVSHDRHFLDAVASEVLELEGGAATHYHGGYRNYVSLAGREAPGA